MDSLKENSAETYRPRVADAELKERLGSAGVVLIEGPKACGKTAMALQVASSHVLLDTDESARRAIAVDPALVLAGDEPRLIDEWQIEPAIWNHIRRAADRRGRSGRFILTGSAVPADDITRHTGAGRISRMHLRTMSLLEMGLSTGEISLEGMFDGRFKPCNDPGLDLQAVVVALCRGGWPGDLDRSERSCLRARVDYLEEVRRTDISRVDDVRRDPENVGRTLHSLARNVATMASVQAIAADVGGADSPATRDSVAEYLDALRRLMIYEEQPAWSPHLRSRSILRKAPKRHFVDPSLAVAALGANPKRLWDNIEFLGFLFESMVYRDLSVYASACDASVFHYRDNTVEVDAVVQNRQGRWCAFEVKLGVGQIDAAAESLLKFKDRIDTKKTGKPGILGVIVGSGYGYVREDGIAVIPIGALGC